MDGVYAMTRSAQWSLVNGTNSTAAPYRWKDVEAACDLYLRTAAQQLNDASNVVDSKGGYAQNTHLMHGATFAVAECQVSECECE